MKSTTILLKTDPHLKSQAQKLAEKCGISLNAVLSRSLQLFVRDRAITFADDMHAVVPNARTAKLLRSQEQDATVQKKISKSFTSPPDATAYLRKVCK